MSFPLVMLLGLGLLSLPLATHRLYSDVYGWAQSQILVDNGAIVMGRAGAQVLNSWTALETKLRRLEGVHHGAHGCARLPGAGAKCLAADLALEKSIDALVAFHLRKVGAVWGSARAHLVPWGVSVRGAGPAAARLEWCPVCRRRTRVQWSPPKSLTIHGTVGASEVSVQWLNSGGWRYRIHPSETEGG